jgi:hypothetical protein
MAGGGRWAMGDISKKSALLHKLQTHVDGRIVIITTAGSLFPYIQPISLIATRPSSSFISAVDWTNLLSLELLSTSIAMSAPLPSELRTIHPPKGHPFRSIDDVRAAIELTRENRLLEAFPSVLAQAQPLLQLYAAPW